MLADEVDAEKVLSRPPASSYHASRRSAARLVSIIVPFNWPIAILCAALPHALLAGNTVIVKPPPSAPLATTRV